MKKILMIFCALLFVISCSEPKQAPEPSAPIVHQAHNIKVQKLIYVDAEFTPQERTLISKAAHEWEKMSDGIVKFDLVFGFKLTEKDQDKEPSKYINKIVLKKANHKDKIIKDVEEEVIKELKESGKASNFSSIKVLGYTMQEKAFEYVYIVADRLTYSDKSLNPRLFQSVVMHELGHEINMEHFDNGPSIMNVMYEFKIKEITGTDLEPLNCLTKFDAMQFCSLYMCEWEKLNYCGK